MYLAYGPYSKQAPGINMQNRTVNADPYGIRINQILYQNTVALIQQKIEHIPISEIFLQRHKSALSTEILFYISSWRRNFGKAFALGAH